MPAEDVKFLREWEIRQAIAEYLSRKGKADYKPDYVFLKAHDGSSRGPVVFEFQATALPNE